MITLYGGGQQRSMFIFFYFLVPDVLLDISIQIDICPHTLISCHSIYQTFGFVANAFKQDYITIQYLDDGTSNTFP